MLLLFTCCRYDYRWSTAASNSVPCSGTPSSRSIYITICCVFCHCNCLVSVTLHLLGCTILDRIKVEQDTLLKCHTHSRFNTSTSLLHFKSYLFKLQYHEHLQKTYIHVYYYLLVLYYYFVYCCGVFVCSSWYLGL